MSFVSLGENSPIAEEDDHFGWERTDLRSKIQQTPNAGKKSEYFSSKNPMRPTANTYSVSPIP